MKTNSMILLLLASIFSAAFAVGFQGTGAPVRAQAPAPAQAAQPAPAQAPTVPAQPKVNLSLEQRHVIKELIKDLDVAPAPQNVETTVGATVPAAIKLNPMPQAVADKVPQIKSHLFFVAGRQGRDRRSQGEQDRRRHRLSRAKVRLTRSRKSAHS